MRRAASIAIRALVAAGILAIVLIIIFVHKHRPVTLRGAVLKQDSDVKKQLPIGDVEVTATNSLGSSSSRSDPSGYFSLTLPKELRLRQPVTLRFRHADYQPLEVQETVGQKIYIVRLTPKPQDRTDSPRPGVAIANAKVRYSVKAAADVDVGSVVKTFEVINAGNVPCRHQPPCSSDGKWKAAVDAAFLDAGQGNQLRNARVSCIAGPCPFTRIEQEEPSPDRQRFNVRIRNWSDTTTFLLEAEVVHSMVSNAVRESYPVIFGRALNFSLPPSAEGPSIEADVGGETIVFPLGPGLILRWAECHASIDKDLSKTYRCELKPGYQFQ